MFVLGVTYSTEITTGTSEARNDTIGVWVYVGNVSKVQAIGALKEECEQCNEPKHGAGILGVQLSNDNEYHASHCAVDVQEDTLAPDVLGLPVDEVGKNTTERTENNVEKTEHGSPVALVLKAERFSEVLLVIPAEDGVDGKFGAEGAEVAGASDKSLHREAHFQDFAEGWLLDDLALGSLDHLLATNVSLARCVVLLLVIGGDLRIFGEVGWGVRIAVTRDGAGNVDNTAADAVRAKI